MAPVCVLFYHRVAETEITPWTMPFSVFRRQIEWLRRHFDLVTLSEAQQRICRGDNRRLTVSITFDDGYFDNCEQALPYLIDESIPCTYFVSTDPVLNGTHFPHDVELDCPLRPNTVDQLRDVARHGIEIGAHTRTHADMGRTSSTETLYDELVTARDDLSDAIEQPIRYFAFPYGQHANLSVEAARLAREVGYAGICSAYGGYNFPGDDPFHLQRIHADSELVKIKNWLTLDPRKQSMVVPFDFGGTKGVDAIPIEAGGQA